MQRVRRARTDVNLHTHSRTHTYPTTYVHTHKTEMCNGYATSCSSTGVCYCTNSPLAGPTCSSNHTRTHTNTYSHRETHTHTRDTHTHIRTHTRYKTHRSAAHIDLSDERTQHWRNDCHYLRFLLSSCFDTHLRTHIRTHIHRQRVRDTQDTQ